MQTSYSCGPVEGSRTRIRWTEQQAATPYRRRSQQQTSLPGYQRTRAVRAQEKSRRHWPLAHCAAQERRRRSHHQTLQRIQPALVLSAAQTRQALRQQRDYEAEVQGRMKRLGTIPRPLRGVELSFAQAAWQAEV